MRHVLPHSLVKGRKNYSSNSTAQRGSLPSLCVDNSLSGPRVPEVRELDLDSVKSFASRRDRGRSFFRNCLCRARSTGKDFLFVAQGLDRVESRRFARRIESEKDPDRGTDKKRRDN